MHAAAFRTGVREAFGVPGGVLAASYIGFGALAYSSAIPLWIVIASTVTIWALPGQLVMVDMWQLGAPLIAILLAVMLTNARFLPMAVTLMPVIRDRSHRPWVYYAAAQCIAMSSWIICMRRGPELPAAERVDYLCGLAAGFIAIGVGASAIGYYIAESIPQVMRIGMVFLAPVYFFVFLIVEVRTRMAAIALVCGGIAGPLLYQLTPQWSVLLAGFIGGTLAFGLNRAWERPRE
ncbi:MAG: AzlC family ABC transporter permease [Burkholderiales bacterium]